MNTLKGGQKMRMTMIRKQMEANPHFTVEQAESAWKEQQRAMASKGGLAKVPKGFAVNKKVAQDASEKGLKSRWNSK